MPIRFKPEVRIKYGQHLEWLELACLWSLDSGITVDINSINDSIHGPNSLHPLGLAVDLDTEGDRSADLTSLFQFLWAHLPKGWQIIHEGDHVHIEYDIR